MILKTGLLLTNQSDFTSVSTFNNNSNNYLLLSNNNFTEDKSLILSKLSIQLENSASTFLNISEITIGTYIYANKTAKINDDFVGNKANWTKFDSNQSLINHSFFKNNNINSQLSFKISNSKNFQIYSAKGLSYQSFDIYID